MGGGRACGSAGLAPANDGWGGMCRHNGDSIGGLLSRVLVAEAESAWMHASLHSSPPEELASIKPNMSKRIFDMDGTVYSASSLIRCPCPSIKKSQ